MRYILAAILLPLAFASPTSPLAPLSKRGETIDDSYIVVFKKDVNPQQMALHLAGLEEWHQADVSVFFGSLRRWWWVGVGVSPLSKGVGVPSDSSHLYQSFAFCNGKTQYPSTISPPPPNPWSCDVG